MPTDPQSIGIVNSPPVTEPYNLLFPFGGRYQSNELLPVDFSAFPLKITIARLHKWWWRVREWTVTVEAQSTTDSMPAQSFVIKAETELVYADVKERTAFMDANLVQATTLNPITYYDYVAGTEFADQTFTDTNSQIQCQLRLMMRGGIPPFPAYDYEPYFLVGDFISPESEIMPLISLRMPLFYSLGGGQFFDSTLESYDRPLGSTDVIDCVGDVIIDGVTFKCRAYRDEDDGGQELSYFSVIIEPTKFWKYDNNESEDIWDESTGTQLRDVVNGVLI